jgi:hypothetical protein
VPTISRFRGIKIEVFAFDHPPPHIHVTHGGDEAVFQFDGAIDRGALPRTETALVREWLALHREDLEICWNQAQEGECPQSIDPL